MKSALERHAARIAAGLRTQAEAMGSDARPTVLLPRTVADAMPPTHPVHTTDDGHLVRYWRCTVNGCIYGFSTRNDHPTCCNGLPMEPAPDHDPDAAKIARTADAVDTDLAGPGAGECTRMGPAWWCTGDEGHDGPCAAWPNDPRDLPDMGAIGYWIEAAVDRQARQRKSSEPLRGNPLPDLVAAAADLTEAAGDRAGFLHDVQVALSVLRNGRQENLSTAPVSDPWLRDAPHVCPGCNRPLHVTSGPAACTLCQFIEAYPDAVAGVCAECGTDGSPADTFVAHGWYSPAIGCPVEPHPASTCGQRTPIVVEASAACTPLPGPCGCGDSHPHSFVRMSIESADADTSEAATRPTAATADPINLTPPHTDQAEPGPGAAPTTCTTLDIRDKIDGVLHRMAHGDPLPCLTDAQRARIIADGGYPGPVCLWDADWLVSKTDRLLDMLDDAGLTITKIVDPSGSSESAAPTITEATDG